MEENGGKWEEMGKNGGKWGGMGGGVAKNGEMNKKLEPAGQCNGLGQAPATVQTPLPVCVTLHPLDNVLSYFPAGRRQYIRHGRHTHTDAHMMKGSKIGRSTFEKCI